VSDNTTCDEPDITPSVFNLDLIVVLMDEVNEFNEPVLTSRLPTLSSMFSVVVATDDDKLPIELLKLLVVVATDDDNPPILESILELNVEYPVVPVISICEEPEVNVGLLVILEKSIDPVIPLVTINEPVISVLLLTLKPFVFETDAVTEPSAICVKLRPVTPLAGMLNKFVPSPLKEPENDPVNEPLRVSKESNLESNDVDTLVYDDVNVLKSERILPLSVSKLSTLPSIDDVNVLIEPE
jgi:hypothetical protein